MAKIQLNGKKVIIKLAKGIICGFGDDGYIMALKAMSKIL